MSASQLVIDKLYGDTFIQAWAKGGIMDRDPRRTGADATPDAFERDEMAEIRPTISVTPAITTPPLSINAPSTAYTDWVDIRVFRAKSSTSMAEVSDILSRIRVLLHFKPLFKDDVFQGYSQWADDLGPLASAQFADTIYAESHVYVTSVF